MDTCTWPRIGRDSSAASSRTASSRRRMRSIVCQSSRRSGTCGMVPSVVAMQPRLLAVLTLVVSVACNRSSTPSVPPTPVAQAPAAAAVSATPRPVAVENIPDWLTYQHDLIRSGQTVGAYNPGGIKRLWQSVELDGLVYAQVLANAGRAFAVTQNNTVYALDAATGRVVWAQHLGQPVPRSALPCGN